MANSSGKKTANKQAKTFWADGIQFQCQGSGRCCVSRGGYGHVWLTRDDRQRMAKVLGLTTATFTRAYCEKQNDVWRLKDGPGEDCRFLKNARCEVYEGRPTQCRTWPFWPEVLNAKTWSTEVTGFCPGVGQGRTWTPAEVEEQLRDQIKSEERYGS